MKTSLLSFTGIILIVSGVVSSCGIKPFPCYTTSIPIDSIHVNEPVIFDAECTDSGKEFFWEINTPSDSFTYIQKKFTHTFDSAGTVELYLYVINGGKSASRKDYFIVLP